MFPGSIGQITLYLPVLCVWFELLHLSFPLAYNFPINAMAMMHTWQIDQNAAACK